VDSVSPDTVIVDAMRTPIGAYGGGLRAHAPSALGARAARAVLDRAGLAPDRLDHVVMGNVLHAEEGAAYLARAVGRGAGVPDRVPALTVNRLCGSGLEAVLQAHRLIATGDADFVLAGGAETLSATPYWSFGLRFGLRMGDGRLLDALTTALVDPFAHVHMGETAEVLAEEYGIGRAEQDAFALESHRRAAAARDRGEFAPDIVPVGEVTQDEHIRPDATLEALSRLRPAFRPGGTVTAGNASGLNDAGAAVLVASAPAAAAAGLRPRAVLRGHAVVATDPLHMGIAPVEAVRRALDRAGISLSAVDLVELNEAFAAQTLAVMRDLDLDPARTNVNGGAIALGHPVGATGAILVTKILSALERRGGRYGLVTLCIGGGQGIAAVLERAA
jgi:acetyl-CoA C-acetyltransferase